MISLWYQYDVYDDAYVDVHHHHGRYEDDSYDDVDDDDDDDEWVTSL